jgi:hypothetical protein
MLGYFWPFPCYPPSGHIAYFRLEFLFNVIAPLIISPYNSCTLVSLLNGLGGEEEPRRILKLENTLKLLHRLTTSMLPNLLVSSETDNETITGS